MESLYFNLTHHLDRMKKLYSNMIEIDLVYHVVKYKEDVVVLERNLEGMYQKYLGVYEKFKRGEIANPKKEAVTAESIVRRYEEGKYVPSVKPVPLDVLYKKSERLRERLPVIESYNFEVVKKIRRLEGLFLSYDIGCCEGRLVV